MKNLSVLLRCFIPRSEATVGKYVVSLEKSRRYYVRVVYKDEANTLEVYNLDCFGNKEGTESTFELENERAFGGAVRSVCRRMGENVPSFEEIDRILTEGPPPWLLEDPS